jgi:hypothetical protein
MQIIPNRIYREHIITRRVAQDYQSSSKRMNAPQINVIA